MPVPLTVVVPTIGRPTLLDRCVASIVACEPQPAEVIVVDQSGDEAVASVVERYADRGTRLVRSTRRGIAAGTNLGIREARHAHVAVTHDDCTVREDWIAATARHAEATPDAIVTGRVLPAGAPEFVPSTRIDELPYDFTGTAAYGVLYPASMVVPRDALLEFGGFDERSSLYWAAEDNDLCYRWLRSGRRLRFEPELVVWHHDWRSTEELEQLYARYARAQGALYAKHLLRGDRQMLRFLAADLARGARSVAGGIRHRRPRWRDERRFLLRGVPAGIMAGAHEELRIRLRRPRAAARAR